MPYKVKDAPSSPFLPALLTPPIEAVSGKSFASFLKIVLSFHLYGSESLHIVSIKVTCLPCIGNHLSYVLHAHAMNHQSKANRGDERKRTNHLQKMRHLAGTRILWYGRAVAKDARLLNGVRDARGKRNSMLDNGYPRVG